MVNDNKLINKDLYSVIINLIKIYIFWLLLFLFYRLVFILCNYNLIKDSGINFSELLPIVWYAVPLDISTISYFATFSCVLLFLDLFVRVNIFKKLSNFFQYLFIIAYTLLAVGEIALYPEWKVKVNAKALEYLNRPQEIFESNKIENTIWQSFLILFLISISIFIYRRFFAIKITKKRNSSKVAIVIPSFLLVLGFIFLGMRGGIQEIPISQSQSYFSKIDIVNDISVNSAWNLGFNIMNTREINDVNIFAKYDSKIVAQRVVEMHKVEKDTTVNILKTPKPNVLFIILESWSADLVKSLGATKFATPQFDKACKDGLLFTHLYSSGNRSQQGLASILGGFPALPITTLTTEPGKMRQTATITTQFLKHNYFTAFYYGGALRYGNIKAYLFHNKFNEIKENHDWNNKIPRGKLGIHDEYMFDLVQEKLAHIKQPFFVNYFTLSSHSPYDEPMKKVINWNDTEDPFHNSVYYTDSCLGVFLEKAKTKDWYKNTIIVIVADHSHQTYTHRSISTAAYRHIPMLITGGALLDSLKGKTYDKICSQTDIGKTVLNQLKFDSHDFFWSKDLMNPYTPQFAYFEMNTGFGWITKDGYLSYDQLNKREVQNTFKTDSLFNANYINGASYLQEVFQQFIDL